MTLAAVLRRIPVTIALCTLLAACEQRPPLPDLVDRESTYTHPQTGLAFPLEVVAFRRTEVVRPDDAQVFVGYEFSSDEGAVVMTMALSPAPPHGCGQAYDDRKRATANANPGVAWLEEENITLHRDGVAYPGRVAVFHFDIRGAPMRGEIFVFCPIAAGWQLSYRVSMPRNVRADERIAAFMSETPAAPAPRADSSRR